MYVVRLFERARELAEDPLRAAQAYDNTVQAINEAEQAALAAINASETAFEKVTCCLAGILSICQSFCIDHCYFFHSLVNI